MNESNKNNITTKLIIISFILYIILYFSFETGYYDYKVHNKTMLTEESIKRFENDISNGKNVSIEDYVINDYIDYSNSFFFFFYYVGSTIEKIMNKSIKKSLSILSDLFYK